MNEGFVDKLDEDEPDSDDDEDTNEEREDTNEEREDTNEEDDDETKEKREDTKEEPETQDIGSLYDDDCRNKCRKSGKSETECKEICTVLCPNPVKYKYDLKELSKLKKIMRERKINK